MSGDFKSNHCYYSSRSFLRTWTYLEQQILYTGSELSSGRKGDLRLPRRILASSIVDLSRYRAHVLTRAYKRTKHTAEAQTIQVLALIWARVPSFRSILVSCFCLVAQQAFLRPHRNLACCISGGFVVGSQALKARRD